MTRHIQKIQRIVEPLKKDSMDSIPRLIDTIPPLVEDLTRSVPKIPWARSLTTDQKSSNLLALTASAKKRKTQTKFQRRVGSSNDASIIKQLNQDLDRALQAFQVCYTRCITSPILTISS